MSTLVDAPHTVWETPAVPLRQAARRARQARVDFWRACVLVAFFVAAIGADLFVGAVVMVGRIQAPVADDVVAASHRTGRFTRPLGDTIFCRYTVFDNKTVQLIEDGIVRCDGEGRMSLTAPKRKFSWSAQ
jgi:hypothetical protein